MRAPVRPLRGQWPSVLERRLARFFWSDPKVVLDDAATPDDFRAAMSAINVGETIKITGANRHPTADRLLVDHVDTLTADIVDIGASDGSTSVDLIRALPGFRSYTIADLYLAVSATRRLGQVLVYDPAGTCILVSGRRYAAWPSISRPVGLLFRPLIRAARDRPREQVLLLNPDARRSIAEDDRIGYRVHDVFQPWPDPKPNVIKVANLLRRLYFSDAQIVSGLGALHASLRPDGHLLIVDNPRLKNTGPRAGLYQRVDDGFFRVAETFRSTRDRRPRRSIPADLCVACLRLSP